MSARAAFIGIRYSVCEVKVRAEIAKFGKLFFEQFWCAMTKDEDKRRALTAHSWASLMVAGKLTTDAEPMVRQFGG